MRQSTRQQPSAVGPFSSLTTDSDVSRQNSARHGFRRLCAVLTVCTVLSEPQRMRRCMAGTWPAAGRPMYVCRPRRADPILSVLIRSDRIRSYPTASGNGRAALPVRVPREARRAAALPLQDGPRLEPLPVPLPEPRRRYRPRASRAAGPTKNQTNRSSRPLPSLCCGALLAMRRRGDC